ncbi:MAG: tyrosine-type recombinase/integrase [Raoultibacter sp.]
MDEAYWSAAAIVMKFVEDADCSARTIACHERGMRQLAYHLDENGLECTRAAVNEWLENWSATWSNCKHKELTTITGRLLEAMETGHVIQSLFMHIGQPAYERLSNWSLVAVDRLISSLQADYKPRTVDVIRSNVSEFFTSNGLLDADSPGLITSNIILDYVETCTGVKGTRCQKLIHLRLLLNDMRDHDEIPAWGSMLATDRFAEHKECYEPVEAWSGETGMSPEEMRELAEAMVADMRETQYSKSVCKVTFKALQMLYVALALNSENYTYKKALAWVEAIWNHLGKQARSYRRAITLLEGYRTQGRIIAEVVFSPHDDAIEKFPVWARDDVAAYLKLREREGYAQSTRVCIANALVRFAAYTDEADISSWGEVTANLIIDWCLSDPHKTAEGRLCYTAKLRGFLEYLEESNVLAIGISMAVVAKCAPNRSVVRVLSTEQVKLCEALRPCASTPKEMRSVAMVALGLTMGLRAIDVVSLKLADISWSKSSITIIQRKTGMQLDLPLSVPAGNAIVAYLRNGRPKSDSLYVFVKHRMPYDGLTRYACTKAMDDIFGSGHGGFHRLRKTFATSMLRGGAGRRYVAEALGHTTEEHVDSYLALDSKRMQLCAISLADAGLAVDYNA